MILPQRKRARAQQDLIANLASGDEVITTSGIYGTLREIEGDVAHLEIAPGTTIRIARRAIAQTVRMAGATDMPPAATDELAAATDVPSALTTGNTVTPQATSEDGA